MYEFVSIIEKLATASSSNTSIHIFVWFIFYFNLLCAGQSNMLGMGRVAGDTDGTLEYAVNTKGLYRYLVNDGDGSWATSRSVRNVRVMSSGNGDMHVYHNEFFTVRGDTIGPEFGIAHCLEEASASETPIMLLKSCIGNRSLGWDLLPPNSPRYDFNGRTYAGYKDSPASWPSNEPKPDPIAWYAGLQYDADIANAKSVLAELDKYYPDATSFEVAGFFWWQVSTQNTSMLLQHATLFTP